jgi:hypothetical protein
MKATVLVSRCLWMKRRRCLSLLVAAPTLASTAEPKALFIEGYAARLSVVQGGEIALHVSTSGATFDVEIARLGSVREVVWKKTGVVGVNHPVPEDASSQGCRWPESLRVPVAMDWKSGYYEISFRTSDAGGKWTHRSRRTAEGSAFFIVRTAQPGSRSKILLQLATNTYNAYNNWGGFSVYAYNSLSNNQGHRVSFERPAASQFLRWELPFVKWAEENGYELEFAANSDLEWHPELLAHCVTIWRTGSARVEMWHSSVATPVAGRCAARMKGELSLVGNKTTISTRSSRRRTFKR